MPLPLPKANLQAVKAVFTDVDGTLTSGGRMESATVRALEWLHDTGIPVVLVSGRPAGWGESWARTLPVQGVIVENGGLYFARDRTGAIKKVYAQRPSHRRAFRERLVREVHAAMKQVPGARLSTDSAYTEVDLAIDYNEEVRLGHEAADTLERILRARGIQAVRSNVHVNCWIGNFDKLTMVERFIGREWDLKLARRDARFVYAGDSFNDAPMFRAFSLSIGVANVRDVLHRIDHPPAFITRHREGRGFRELVREILAQRRSK